MRFWAGKMMHLVAVVLTVSILTFVMLDLLPVSIAHEIAGQGATAADLAAVRARLGLNDPAPVRFGSWLANLLRGDFGASFVTGQPVGAAIRSQLPVTLELLALAQLIALALAVPIGILSAWRAGSLLDRFFATVGMAFTAVPKYALAIVFVFIFAVRLRWFPATGYTALSEGIWPNLRGLLLPAFSIALAEWVIPMRVLRSDLIATLKEDFILLARAKGLPGWKILLGHALRPSSFTLITLVGIHIGDLIGGVVIVENVFALPGIGRLLLSGIFSQDFPVVQACVVVIAAGYVLLNSLVDACYGLLDPRTLKGGSGGR